MKRCILVEIYYSIIIIRFAVRFAPFRPETESQIKDFHGKRFKKFDTEQEAQDFIDGKPSKAASKSKKAEPAAGSMTILL